MAADPSRPWCLDIVVTGGPDLLERYATFEAAEARVKAIVSAGYVRQDREADATRYTASFFLLRDIALFNIYRQEDSAVLVTPPPVRRRR